MVCNGSYARGELLNQRETILDRLAPSLYAIVTYVPFMLMLPPSPSPKIECFTGSCMFISAPGEQRRPCRPRLFISRPPRFSPLRTFPLSRESQSYRRTHLSPIRSRIAGRLNRRDRGIIRGSRHHHHWANNPLITGTGVKFKLVESPVMINERRGFLEK